MNVDRLGIMQPYFAPGLGYFDLIHITTHWIVFDTAQYRRRSWMNRNRVLHPDEGTNYITAAVEKASRDTPIHDIVLADRPWRQGILGKLTHYANKAPHYDSTVELVESVLERDQNTLVELNIDFLSAVCDALDIPFRYSVFSKMDLELGPIDGPGDWALRISEALGARQYINPPGGRKIFEPEKFDAVGTELIIREFPELEYEPYGHEFISTLSVVDVLMWNSTDDIRSHLDDCKASFEAEHPA